jgi:hypothetical protein
MQLQAWYDTAAVSFDRQLCAELTSLRFLADAYNVLLMLDTVDSLCHYPCRPGGMDDEWWEQQ